MDLDKMAAEVWDAIDGIEWLKNKPVSGHQHPETTILAALVKAHRAGWDKGVSDFAIWKNGEQLVGCMQTPLKEVLKRGPS